MMDAARRPMPLCRWVLTSLRLWNPNLRWRRPRVGRGHLTRTATMPPFTVISRKTGARTRVAARFQAYIDDLEANHGGRVLFMGGIRPGRCSPSSEHPCGKALDVCQLRRG